MAMTIHAGDCLSGCAICTANYHAGYHAGYYGGREGAGKCEECGAEL